MFSLKLKLRFSPFLILLIICIASDSFSIVPQTCGRGPPRINLHYVAKSIASSSSFKASRIAPIVILHAEAGTQDGTSLLDEIRSMRVKEIKAELQSMSITTQDVFEKEELVQRLFEARQKLHQQTKATTTSSQTSSATASVQSPSSSQQRQSATTSKPNILETPLYLTSLQAGTRIAAVNGADIAIESADHPYPTIKIQVTPTSGSSQEEFTLNLLLDTACSGLVLRPSVVQKYGLPSLSTPVTMTGAGGVSSNPGLTQLDRFRLQGHTFGPLPAAVQDIGALPSSLDGIIGLSFLNQFAGADMDFRKGKLSLYPKGQPLPEVPTDSTVVAEGAMSLVRSLSIYMVDVYLGGRGPVKMLVDSGASNTFLNWKGVSDLSLSRDSKFLNRLPNPMGAVGSDAVAMALTHRINISSNLNLGKTSYPGLPLKDTRRLKIDIGDIAILEAIKGDGVGGILGIDSFMRCDSVRMTFQGSPIIQLLLSKEEVDAL